MLLFSRFARSPFDSGSNLFPAKGNHDNGRQVLATVIDERLIERHRRKTTVRPFLEHSFCLYAGRCTLGEEIFVFICGTWGQRRESSHECSS